MIHGACAASEVWDGSKGRFAVAAMRTKSAIELRRVRCLRLWPVRSA